jgi:nitrate reductase / nitrite oxidoreductase, beta subunit
MPSVYNWQLGRPMDYPYAEHHPRKQFVFVFNTNRCIACHTCTMACKSTWTFSRGQEVMWWNNVESKPYGGYPQNWDVKLLELLERAAPENRRWTGSPNGDPAKPYGTFEGRTIFEAADMGAAVGEAQQRALGYLPTIEEWRAPNLYEDTAVGEKGVPLKFTREAEQLPEHSSWFFYLPRICNHCTYPGCVAACHRQAIYKRPEDGVVLIDQSRCRGYRKCMEGCPYKKAMFRPNTRISEKCVACYPRLEGKDPEGNGEPQETRCMEACIGQIRLQGLVDVDEDNGWREDRYNPLYYLIRVAKVALPLYPQFGTEPNGYYIPPRWAPRPYLKQMFGPGVDNAIERYMVPDRELLAVLQLFRRSNKIIFKYRIEEGPKVFETEIYGKPFTQYDDTIIAYDRHGQEMFRTNVNEPIHVRPDIHQNSI